MNRGELRTIVADWRKPELPEAIEYAPRRPEQANREAESAVKDPVTIETSLPDSPDPSPVAQDDEVIVPASYNLAVPFQPQAPHASWDLPYQEACEEASLIMAAHFFEGRGLTAGEMDVEIKKLVAWEESALGYYEDTTAEEVARIAREYFNLSVELDTDVTIENIKRSISQNKLVIVPAAGRILPNPYFSGEGPLYHMLVIRGYTDTHFITNDPGTKRGKEFVYAYDDLLDAVHDWPREHGGNASGVNEEEMLTGRKVMLVVDKRS